MEVVAFAARECGADGLEELFEDGIEALDFAACGGEVGFEGRAVSGGEFAEFPAEELEVDVEGVERVSDFVGNAGGEEG